MKVIVNDTNIFIDLQSIGLLRKMCELPFEIHTVDFVIAEIATPEYRTEIQQAINENLIHVREFTAEEIVEIVIEQASAPGNISIQDCSVCYYARNGAYTLITGDRQLRAYAENCNVEVHGVLYLFDQMIENSILLPSEASIKLRELLAINVRLPRAEILKRITLWESKS